MSKQIRIRLNDDDAVKFLSAKDAAEKASGVTLTDTQFAASLVKKAID